MVGHIVAPMDWCTRIVTPYGEYVCNSTADCFVRYILKTQDNIAKHEPRIYEEMSRTTKKTKDHGKDS
jgi:hypothetical protein